MDVEVPSCNAMTWCTAWVVPLDTLTILLIALYLFESTPTIVDKALTLLKLDFKLTDLSDPANWVVSLNLYVPVPTDVVPNPTALARTSTVLIPVLEYSNDNIFDWRLDLKVPIKLEEKFAISPLST